jgi:hypothetical protein
MGYMFWLLIVVAALLIAAAIFLGIKENKRTGGDSTDCTEFKIVPTPGKPPADLKKRFGRQLVTLSVRQKVFYPCRDSKGNRKATIEYLRLRKGFMWARLRNNAGFPLSRPVGELQPINT